jgi:hypothetical protein
MKQSGFSREDMKNLSTAYDLSDFTGIDQGKIQGGNIKEYSQILYDSLNSVGNADEPMSDRYFENHVYSEKSKIKERMKTYGFKTSDLKNMTNYYDLSTVTGIDTRKLKDVDVRYYGRLLAELL